jgi:hypothetical protein
MHTVSTKPALRSSFTSENMQARDVSGEFARRVTNQSLHSANEQRLVPGSHHAAGRAAAAAYAAGASWPVVYSWRTSPMNTGSVTRLAMYW